MREPQEVASIWGELAAWNKPCPYHPASKDGSDLTWRICTSCQGTSRVIMLPQLRRECPCKGQRDFVAIRKLPQPNSATGLDWETVAEDLPCSDCQGHAWVPVDPHAEVLADALGAAGYGVKVQIYPPSPSRGCLTLASITRDSRRWEGEAADSLLALCRAAKRLLP